MTSIAGQPLIHWIIQRLQKIGAPLVLATTDRAEDEALVGVARKCGVECYRHKGDPGDVVGRMAAAAERYPGTKFYLRALGDMPFVSWELVQRAAHILERNNGDVFLWYAQPDCWPLYGCREFFHHIKILQLTNQYARGEQREHPDLWLNQNRDKVKIIYHEPPATTYFRPNLRLEVDYPQDIELVRAVAEKGPGMLAPVKDVVQFLDKNDTIARLNWGCVEKTGPSVSYASDLKRRWFALMKGKPVYKWDGGYWEPDDSEDSPKFCTNGSCFVGWGMRRTGQIKTKEGHIIEGSAWISCPCGAGLFTRERF